MKCKNCIHYDVCQYHIDEETTMTVAECAFEFRHKDQYVKLPAFVGQEVWYIKHCHKFEDGQFKVVDYKVGKGKVSMLQQKADKSWKIRITFDHSVSDYTLEEFGTAIFLSEIDANNKVEILKRSLV